MSTPSATEQALARDGDRLYRIALGMLRDVHEAEDAVQEAMLRHLRYSGRFRDADHERAWLITVTMNLCRDMLRRRERRAALPLDAAADLPADAPGSDILADLDALPVASRQILVLHYLEGYSVREAAALLGISESAAKMRLKAGRDRLKAQVQGKTGGKTP